MLKIKDNVNIKELEKYGFKFIYNEDTGKIEEAYKFGGLLFGEKIINFILKSKIKPKYLRFSYYENREAYILDDYIPRHQCRDRYCFNFNALYDLIQDGIIEKIGDD